MARRSSAESFQDAAIASAANARARVAAKAGEARPLLRHRPFGPSSAGSSQIVIEPPTLATRRPRARELREEVRDLAGRLFS